ncbi:MAG: cysteine desulfurase [Thermofilaceae archaeon]
MLNPYEIRKDFPLLEDRGIIYLDNAATSQKPIQVIKAVERFYRVYNANIHRGLHVLSREASREYEEAHDVVARFINAKSWREVIFVRNTTEAINLVAYSWAIDKLKSNDEIIVTVMEHHSNLLPWVAVAKKLGVKIKMIGLTSDYTLDYETLNETVTERTRIIAVSHVSNVIGTVNDVKNIATLAHEVGAICIVDGAQSVPHMPVNVRGLDCDFLAFSGHKMLGPTGIGVLYGKEDLLEEMKPFMYGGDMVKEVKYYSGVVEPVWNDLPWKFEAGTPNIAGGVGLAEAVRYLEKIGMESVRAHEVELTNYAVKRLSEIEELKLFGPSSSAYRCGIISFNLTGLDPHSLAAILDNRKIAVRSGFHCAQPLHEYLGLKEGTVRASFYIYNTREEVDLLHESLTEVAKIVKGA